jgi:hypothetical protein
LPPGRLYRVDLTVRVVARLNRDVVPPRRWTTYEITGLNAGRSRSYSCEVTLARPGRCRIFACIDTFDIPGRPTGHARPLDWLDVR